MEQSISWTKDGFTLRRARVEDVEAYYSQNYCPLDAELAKLTGSKSSFSEEEVKSFFLKALEDKERYFFLILSPEDKIIGECVVNEIDWELRSANFRIAIFQVIGRNKGLGTWVTEKVRDFVFEVLNLHRLSLNVYSFNPRAEKVYLKAGFKREGVLRDAVMLDGNYYDDILMAILKPEWEVLKSL